MTCAELRELAAAHALGALDHVERAEVEAHLASVGPHEGCQEAVDRALATAAELAHSLVEVPPSAGVWSAIEARIGDVERRPPRRWAVPLGLGAAAAAAVLAALLVREGLLVGRLRDEVARARLEVEVASADRERLRAELAALLPGAALRRDALALLEAPGTRLVALAPQPGQAGRATAIVNAAARRALVVSASLPPRPGRTYQLWVIRGAAAPSPAGFLTPLEGGVTAGEIDRALLEGPPPDALAVSLEPAGGSPSPTQVVLVGGLSG